MYPKDNPVSAAAALEQYFESGTYGHAATVADLVLERLPNGEYAWLKPSTEPAEDDEARYWPSDRGHDLVARMRANEAVFGPCPSVAEVIRGTRL